MPSHPPYANSRDHADEGERDDDDDVPLLSRFKTSTPTCFLLSARQSIGVNPEGHGSKSAMSAPASNPSNSLGVSSSSRSDMELHGNLNASHSSAFTSRPSPPCAANSRKSLRAPPPLKSRLRSKGKRLQDTIGKTNLLTQINAKPIAGRIHKPRNFVSMPNSTSVHVISVDEDIDENGANDRLQSPLPSLKVPATLPLLTASNAPSGSKVGPELDLSANPNGMEIEKHSLDVTGPQCPPAPNLPTTEAASSLLGLKSIPIAVPSHENVCAEEGRDFSMTSPPEQSLQLGKPPLQTLALCNVSSSHTYHDDKTLPATECLPPPASERKRSVISTGNRPSRGECAVVAGENTRAPWDGIHMDAKGEALFTLAMSQKNRRSDVYHKALSSCRGNSPQVPKAERRVDTFDLQRRQMDALAASRKRHTTSFPIMELKGALATNSSIESIVQNYSGKSRCFSPSRDVRCVDPKITPPGCSTPTLTRPVISAVTICSPDIVAAPEPHPPTSHPPVLGGTGLPSPCSTTPKFEVESKSGVTATNLSTATPPSLHTVPLKEYKGHNAGGDLRNMTDPFDGALRRFKELPNGLWHKEQKTSGAVQDAHPDPVHVGDENRGSTRPVYASNVTSSVRIGQQTQVLSEHCQSSRSQSAIGNEQVKSNYQWHSPQDRRQVPEGCGFVNVLPQQPLPPTVVPNIPSTNTSAPSINWNGPRVRQSGGVASAIFAEPKPGASSIWNENRTTPVGTRFVEPISSDFRVAPISRDYQSSLSSAHETNRLTQGQDRGKPFKAVPRMHHNGYDSANRVQVQASDQTACVARTPSSGDSGVELCNRNLHFDGEKRDRRTLMPFLSTATRRAQYEQGRALAFVDRNQCHAGQTSIGHGVIRPTSHVSPDECLRRENGSSKARPERAPFHAGHSGSLEHLRNNRFVCGTEDWTAKRIDNCSRLEKSQTSLAPIMQQIEELRHWQSMNLGVGKSSTGVAYATGSGECSGGGGETTMLRPVVAISEEAKLQPSARESSVHASDQYLLQRNDAQNNRIGENARVGATAVAGYLDTGQSCRIKKDGGNYNRDMWRLSRGSVEGARCKMHGQDSNETRTGAWDGSSGGRQFERGEHGTGMEATHGSNLPWVARFEKAQSDSVNGGVNGGGDIRIESGHSSVNGGVMGKSSREHKRLPSIRSLQPFLS